MPRLTILQPHEDTGNGVVFVVRVGEHEMSLGCERAVPTVQALGMADDTRVVFPSCVFISQQTRRVCVHPKRYKTTISYCTHTKE